MKTFEEWQLSWYESGKGYENLGRSEDAQMDMYADYLEDDAYED